MAEFKRKTNVRFVEREDETQYIHIEPETKCSSVVGKSVRNVSQVLISEGCYELGTILHELMHVLGFVHEQNRPDRDEFIRVVWDNIQEGAKKNFQKFSPDVVTTLGSEYDYNSLMHYDANAFAINSSLPTLVPLRANTTLGNREGFSEKDLIRINTLYNCSSTAEMSEEPIVDKSLDRR
ncbi:zinc metalloproteinase nas-13 [Trichonephila clavata]|uniref:Metalloendopeptidase n=1 Tax=Trichonephila clavata TaxID=2740835 RepID=A0A8X6H4H1_TRICU|nr:zinc metalloproteinase nas-13 [Trichonephila clavata]